MTETPAGRRKRAPIQGSGYTPLEMLGVVEPHICVWPTDKYDPWRCPNFMVKADDEMRTEHHCAASVDHEGDHCCILGTRWPRPKPKPRRYWRDRIRTWIGGERP